MNFEFSSEQVAFRDQIERLLNDVSPLGEMRRCIDANESYSARAWRGLADIGLLGVTASEAVGGAALAGFELCVGFEAVGRNLAPVPLLSSIGLAGEAIRLFGSESQQARWLPGLIDGSLIGAWTYARSADALRYDNGAISGEIRFVNDGGAADILVAALPMENGEARIVAADLRSGAVTREASPSIDPSKPCAALSLREVSAETLDGAGVAQVRMLIERAAVLLAFEQLGGASRALEMALAHVQERRAFGRVIGANQAIKHRLADMYARIELARAHAYHGAWAFATNARELPLAAAGAVVSSAQAFIFAAQENLHLHGGIGFTWEADCHLLLRRARRLANLLGSELDWKERIVGAIESDIAEFSK